MFEWFFVLPCNKLWAQYFKCVPGIIKSAFWVIWFDSQIGFFNHKPLISFLRELLHKINLCYFPPNIHNRKPDFSEENGVAIALSSRANFSRRMMSFFIFTF